MTIAYQDLLELRRPRAIRHRTSDDDQTVQFNIDADSQFRSAFENAPIGMALMGLDHGYLYVNASLSAMTGYARTDLQELTLADVTHPDDLAADLAGMATLLSGAVPNYTIEVRILTASGEAVSAVKSASLARADDGSPLHFIVQIQDITGRKNVELALAEEHRRLHEAELIARMGSWDVDVETGEIQWSDALFALRGLDKERFGNDLASAYRWVHPDDRDRVSSAIAECGRTGEPMLARYRITRANDSQLRWFDARAEAVYEAGRVVRVAGTVIDVTADVRAAERASADSAFKNAVISSSPDVIFVYDLVARSTVWTNRSVPELLGYPDDGEPAGDVIGRFVHVEDRAEYDATLDAIRDEPGDAVVVLNHRLDHADGTTRWFSRRTAALHRDSDGRIVQTVGVLRDITDAVAVEQRWSHSALHDSLTGLPNRALLMDRLEGALARSERDHHEVSILFCDLNGFKAVNDGAGHAAGDAVLQETARRLQAALRDGDTVARVGGDEFVVVIEPWNRVAGDGAPDQQLSEPADQLRDRTLARRIAERIAESLRQPVVVRGVSHVVSASIGIAYGSTSAAHDAGDACAITADDVLQHADAAMYRAKTNGGCGIEVFEEGLLG